MQEIKVGEYVRTKNGNIDKIINIERYNEEEKWLVGENFRKGLDNGYYGRTTDNDILKHSPNIIDLIEEGDYVNGEKVVRIIEPDILGDEKLTDKEIYIGYADVEIRVFEEDIKTILTKELYTANCYEVN